MKTILCFIAVLLTINSTLLAVDDDAAARQFYSEKSYAQAAALWQKILGNEKPEKDSDRWRELTFRIADAQWRAESGTESRDQTVFTPITEQLEELRKKENDLWSAEANESLGDFFQRKGFEYNFGQSQNYYQLALEYWGNQNISDEARLRYLRLAFKPLRPEVLRAYGNVPSFWNLKICENAVKLAKSKEEIAHAHYLLLGSLLQQGGAANPALWRRIKESIDLALTDSKDTPWYDDVLFRAANWYESSGALEEVAPAQYQAKPDFEQALVLYRRLTTEFREGESKYFKNAGERIKEITEPQVSVQLGSAFMPGSIIEFGLQARNVNTVDLSLHKLDLAAAYNLQNIPHNQTFEPNKVTQGIGAIIRNWTVETKAKEPYGQFQETQRTDPVPPGAYWLEVQAGGKSSGEILLVTNLSVTAQNGLDKELVFTCDSRTGAPKPDARILHMRYYRHNSNDAPGTTNVTEGKTTADGTCLLNLAPVPPDTYLTSSILIAMAGDEPALIQNNNYGYGRTQQSQPFTYIYTDRPAYRPGETAHFKAICRFNDGKNYVLPEPGQLKVIVHDPQGKKLLEKEFTLSPFGSVADSVAIPENAPLGAYTIELRFRATRNPNEEKYLGNRELFRIEEYKLPEFRVTVKMPEKDGKPEIFRLGEKIKAEVKVEYYSGGAVPNADVNYSIVQKPFVGDNPWPEPYPWYYRNIQSSAPWMCCWRPVYNESIIKQDHTKTDARGNATIELETPYGNGQDLEYRIDARVTDASRRQVNGSGSVKVTATPFHFYLKPEAQVYEPGSTAKIDVKALDANGNGRTVEATVLVTRENYVEKVRKNKKTGQERIVFRGYDSKEIERQDAHTDADGYLRINQKFTETGYYRVKVISPPVEPKGSTKKPAAKLPDRVVGETTLFVADAKTQDLGYRYGQLQIFPDKTSYKVGDTARLIIITPSDDTTALLIMSGEDLLDHQVLHLDGTAKLAEFKISDACQPNVFISGLSIKNNTVMTANEEVIVPPAEHFLNISVTPDAKSKTPHDKGSFLLKVSDTDGKPVRAEVSLAVIDAAIYYIQTDLAGDIREFYYGTKHQFTAYPRAMLNERALLNIEPDKKSEDEEEIVRPVKDYMGDLAANIVNGRLAGLDEERDDKDAVYAGMPSSTLQNGPRREMARAKGMAFGGMTKTAGVAAESVNADMLASNRPPMAAPAQAFNKEDEQKKQKGENGSEPEVVVRSDFRSTAFWDPALVTDEKGEAHAELTYPDSLTEWKAVAKAVTTGAQFGGGDADTKTSQPLMVRLQTPRFLVEGDRVTISAVINNVSGKEALVTAILDASNLTSVQPDTQSVTVATDDQKRVDRVFDVPKSGKTEVKAEAKSTVGNDAMKLDVPIVEHGIEKFLNGSFVLECKPGNDGRFEVGLNLPAERNPGTTSLRIQLAPSLASTCLDALPYLARYPYGCVEQTMSRYLPAAIAAKTLKYLDLDPQLVAGRLFGGMEPGSATALEMERGDLTKLQAMIDDGDRRIADMQHGDGGWGWWKEGPTDDFMTAYVVQGLSLARSAGIDVDRGRISRGASYLERRLVQYEDDPAMAAWLLYAISLTDQSWNNMATKAADHAWDQRDQLNAYTRSLLALVFNKRAKVRADFPERAQVLVRNLENGVKEVKAPSAIIGAAGSSTMPTTCHWGEDGISYRWSDGGVEATAMALRAMLAISPENPHIDEAARWLINNRRGAQWKNTRDTAIVILSLLDYMKTKKELNPDLKAQILVNGAPARDIAIGKDQALGTLDLQIPEKMLKAGQNKIAVSVSGSGRLYVSAYLKYFTKEEPITAAGNEIYVKREYYRESTRPKLVEGVNVVRNLLKDGDQLVSGDEIEVRLVLEAKNNYEYLVFEDKKPAGCEALQIRSGEPMYARALRADGKFEGEQTWVYQELRDQHVAFFISKLKSGQHEIRYKLRAETPGRFHALPTLGHAMYVPEIRANSDEVRFTIIDKPKAN